VPFESDPHLVHRAESYELRMAFFQGSEGKLLALIEEKRYEGAPSRRGV
jgi:hypothetical protein